jgi:CDP-diacylglycerol--serine O-phosphatidyltransferase
VILGFLMVSRWKFPSLKTLHFRVPSFQLVLMTVILAIFVLYGILHFFPIMLFGLTWGYILLGSLLSVIRMIAGKKSKTLEDFEPKKRMRNDRLCSSSIVTLRVRLFRLSPSKAVS